MPPSELRIIASGTAAVGVGYGFARYGYGLLLPDIRADLRVGSSVLGLIGSGSYAAYLLATGLVPFLAPRTGPRGLVVAGLLLGSLGMLLVAVSSGPLGLAAGLVVAGTSSALVFPPFSDLISRNVRAPRRGRALATVSSGTGWGVALSVPIALAAGASWRSAWLAYAVLAAVVAAGAWRSLPARDPSSSRAQERVDLRLSWFVCPRSGPLLAGALLVGAGSSVYWTFAVDHVVSAGGIAAADARLLLAVVGLASIAGALTGDLVERIGARATLTAGILALASALALLGLGPGNWIVLLPSAVLFGGAYNVVVAVQGIWSARVFADRPSTGLAAVMLVLGVGLLIGPVLAGFLADRLTLGGVFALGALVVACVTMLFPREDLRAARDPAPLSAG